MAGIIRVLVIGLLLCIPVPYALRTTKRLSWTKAVVAGTWLLAIGLIFVAEIPSRILYYVDSRSADWAPHLPSFLRFTLNAGGAGQSLLADAAANTVQGIFAVAILVIAYFWGEKQRKTGRFSRR